MKYNAWFKWVMGVLALAVAIMILVFNSPKTTPDVPLNPGTKPVPTPTANNSTGIDLVLPEKFRIETFATDLPGARVIVQDVLGNYWVSQTDQGTITQLEMQDGKVARQNAVFRSLDKPHGLAIDPANGTMLYFAEEGRISRVPLYSDGSPEVIANLPAGGGHSTRTIAFGPDDRLYVSIGSSCNVCEESDPRRAAIFSMNKDGSDFKKFASGLRNSVFFDWSYVDGRMWATDNGRDNLGDNVPADEVNIIREGGNYGWPLCFGKNIHDTNFDKKTYVQNPCAEPQTLPAYVEIQAHSAPLGLGFIPEEGWPEDYWYDLIVALHGSWNRSEPTGYKLIRIKLNERGEYQGTEDFVSGWLTPNGDVKGRPVSIMIRPGGFMLVTDDEAGVVYQITYLQE